MHRFLLGLGLMAVVTFFAGACAVFSGDSCGDQSFRNPSMRILVDPNQQIPQSGSYAWGPHYYRVQSDKNVDLEAVDERLRSSVKKELHRRGYEQTEEDPTLIVSFAAGLDAELDEMSLNKAYGDEFSCPLPAGKVGENRTYNKGTLVIDVMDAKTKKLCWRGAILADIDMNATKKEKDCRVKKAVRTLLDQFPKPRTAN